MEQWGRVSPLTIGATAIRSVLPLTPVLFGMLVLGGSGEGEGFISLGILSIILVALVVAQVFRWWRTTYRLTDERLELRTGLLVTSHRSIPRHRVRRVDLTTPFFHRILGISVVTIGTGESASSESESLTIDAIPSLSAAQLRDALLAPRIDASSPTVGPTTSAQFDGLNGAVHDTGNSAHDMPTSYAAQAVTQESDAHTLAPPPTTMQTLAKFSWSWAPYGLFSSMTLWLPFIFIAGLYQIVAAWTTDSVSSGIVEQSGDFVRSAPVITLIVVIVLGGIAVGTIGSLVTYFINWFGFILMKDQKNVLHSERGLFTRYSRTFDLSRVRGIAWSQTLPLRYLRGGRLHIIAQGLSGTDGDTGPRVDSLLPAAPQRDSRPVVEELCGFDALAEPLTVHPLGALHRRLFRAAMLSLVVIGVAVIVAQLSNFDAVAWSVGIGLPIVLWVVAVAEYRGLGHAITSTHLLTRSGAWTRQTIVLERHGIIGIGVQQSFFQRRRGLATMWAITAAGNGAYSVIDVTLEDAMALAIECDPAVTQPFTTLETVSATAGSTETRNSPWP